jgi:hypothetical protein
VAPVRRIDLPTVSGFATFGVSDRSFAAPSSREQDRLQLFATPSARPANQTQGQRANCLRGMAGALLPIRARHLLQQRSIRANPDVSASVIHVRCCRPRVKNDWLFFAP